MIKIDYKLSILIIICLDSEVLIDHSTTTYSVVVITSYEPTNTILINFIIRSTTTYLSSMEV